MKGLVVKFVFLWAGFLVALGVVHADTFSPVTAAPGGTVTLTGQAKPNSAMSGYFSCSAGCGQTHIGVATANAQGAYSLTFTVPAAAKPGGAYVQIGCDNCGNGWRTVGGLQLVIATAAPNNALSPQQKQQMAQIGTQLDTFGSNILVTRDQVIRSIGVNNAQLVDSILNAQEAKSIGNSFIASGNQISGISRQTQALNDQEKKGVITGLKAINEFLQAKMNQVDQSIAEKQRVIDAKQPSLNKENELVRFWKADMEQHQRNSDDAARRCNKFPPDAGACGYWPQEAAAIEASKTKMGIHVVAAGSIEAEIIPLKWRQSIEAIIKEELFAKFKRSVDAKIEFFQRL